MARRKTRDPELTLFPFLSVLAVVMGTLILIIAGMSQLALANPKQRIEVEKFDPAKKTPVYVECSAEGATIYPDDPTSGTPTFVSRYEINSPRGAWNTLVRRVEHHSATQYILLLIRPDGVGTFEAVRASLQTTTIELGYEPLFGDGDVRFSEKRR